ncbi:FkbM family methyltransferase [Phenylobacterium sp.]|uniref:FkbM family methyltransferase n=1 Tax=Phenylobacterium sp. TaxID=1871053 RepID=UPI003561ACF4
MSADVLSHILDLPGALQVADIGAACLGAPPPYHAMVLTGLAHLNAFDADVRQHPKLRETYGERLTLFPQVVGDGTRQMLHIASPASGMTSLLRPLPERLAFFNGFTEFGRIQSRQEVETRRLDDIVGLPDIDFLKMDIQGAELQVLTHGETRLAGCAMIQLEVSFIPLYEGQPTFGEIDGWMRAHGFIPHCFTEVKRWSISPVRRNSNDRQPFNQLLEADAVYMRNVIDPELDPNLLKKIALLAHHGYRSVDLTGHILTVLEGRGLLAGGSFTRYLASLNAKGDDRAPQ